MERFNFIFVVAGLGFFAIAFIIMGWMPIIQYRDIEVVTMEQIAQNIPYQFDELIQDYPELFATHFDLTDPGDEEQVEAAFIEALQYGKKVYMSEACWHCHSQQIRRIDPNDGTAVGNDVARWAEDTYTESLADEYYNEMNYPHLFGTRRVGPDLIRESGRQSNSWHLAHFWNPRHTTPYSVMPAYPWFFEDDEGLIPNKKGLSIVTYMQWLGSWYTQFAPSPYEDLPEIPFDESWYPPVEPAVEPDVGDEEYGDEYGDPYGEEDPYGDEDPYGEEDPYGG